MKSHCKRCLRLGRTVFGLGLALLAAAQVERLEAQISTASLEVAVAGLDGRPLSGVTAALENTATGLTRTATTSGQGTATLAALPPGIYRARFTLQGFSPFESDGIELHMGQTARLAVTLSPAARLTETITVNSSVPLTDRFKTESSANVLPEQIAALPLPNRDVQRLAFLAPGVERERSPFRSARGSPVVGSGGDASQSVTFVDGLDFTSAVGEQLKIHFSQDAVSELRVINRSYDSEIGGTVGGALSIVTRSGTNQIHGSAFGFYRAGNGDSSRAHYGLTAGGPLRPDRSHYFVAGEQIAEKNIAFVRPGGAFSSLATDAEHPFDQTLVLRQAEPSILGRGVVGRQPGLRTVPGKERRRRRRFRRVQRLRGPPRQLEPRRRERGPALRPAAQ